MVLLVVKRVPMMYRSASQQNGRRWFRRLGAQVDPILYVVAGVVLVVAVVAVGYLCRGDAAGHLLLQSRRRSHHSPAGWPGRRTQPRRAVRWGTLLGGVFRRSDLDDGFWQRVEDALIAADVGVAPSVGVVERARERRPEDPQEALEAVRAELLAALEVRRPGPPASLQAIGHCGRRGERCRQDHDDRQVGRPRRERRTAGPARRRRHLPRRRRRPAADLGRPGGGRCRRRSARVGPGRGRLRCLQRRQGTRRRRARGGHRGEAPLQAQPHAGAGQGGEGAAARGRVDRRGPPRPRCHRRSERARAGPGLHRGGWGHRDRAHQDGRDGATVGSPSRSSRSLVSR